MEGTTVDLSESGFRMALPQGANANDIVGGSRSLNIRLVLNEDEEPVMAVAEFIWAKWDEAVGANTTGWMFTHLIEGERRLKEYIQASSDGARSA